jgi:hypothetical protein
LAPEDRWPQPGVLAQQARLLIQVAIMVYDIQMDLITQTFDLALDLRCVHMHKYQVDVGGFADERFFFQQGTG